MFAQNTTPRGNLPAAFNRIRQRAARRKKVDDVTEADRTTYFQRAAAMVWKKRCHSIPRRDQYRRAAARTPETIHAARPRMLCEREVASPGPAVTTTGPVSYTH